MELLEGLNNLTFEVKPIKKIKHLHPELKLHEILNNLSLELKLQERINKLPLELIWNIMKYILNPQPKALLNEIRSFHLRDIGMKLYCSNDLVRLSRNKNKKTIIKYLKSRDRSVELNVLWDYINH